MKISIITTVNHNVGDDFVREGIKYILRQHFKDKSVEFQHIHKHSPITTRYGFEWFRYLRLSRRVDKVIPKEITKDRVLDADLLVQSGAPVYWCHQGGPHCCRNEWYKPLIKERYLNSKKNPILINLAAGTCQKYYSDGQEFCDDCYNYIQEFSDLSKVTTVRDTLAQHVLAKIGVEVPVIPCSSIFAIDEHNIRNEGEEYVAINYMKGGAHYTFGQDIDFERWRNNFKRFYFELKYNERVVFVCHNEKEKNDALEVDPKAEIFYKKDDYLAYMQFYSKAKFGIMNRLHGAFLLASFGKPSVVIGNDSRARMATEIGLESYFVNDVDFTLLCSQYDYLKTGANGFTQRFKVIKEKAYIDYMNALSVI